jgi:hypothetical protein
MSEKLINISKKILSKTVIPFSLILMSGVNSSENLSTTIQKKSKLVNNTFYAGLRFDDLPYRDDPSDQVPSATTLNQGIPNSVKPELITNGSIAFIAGPKEGYNFVQEINIADKYLKLAKELGLARIAVELPNKLNEKDGQDYLRALAGLSQKYDIKSVLWISNSLPGAQLPLFEVNKKIIAQHPEWFLRNSSGKVIVEQSEFKARAYQNPFSQTLQVEQRRLIRISVQSLNANSILFDDLAIPIQNSAFKSSVEFKNQPGGNNELTRQKYYTKKMKDLQEICRQDNKKMILSTQLSAHSKDLKTLFDSPKMAAKFAQEAMPQIYTRTYYSGQGKASFNSQLTKNAIQFSRNRALNPSLKITPLVFAGYPEQPNSTGDILKMSKLAKVKLNAGDVGIFPLKTIYNMTLNDPNAKLNIQKALGAKN